MKFRPMEAELFHSDGRRDGQTDRQTDMAKPTVVFRNFANVRKYGYQNSRVWKVRKGKRVDEIPL